MNLTSAPELSPHPSTVATINYRAGGLIGCKLCERRNWVDYRTKIIQMANICEAHSIVVPRVEGIYDICYCPYHGPIHKPQYPARESGQRANISSVRNLKHFGATEFDC